MKPRTLYNETHQHLDRAPTAYESLLGDSIERAFAQGLHDLESLVAYLNQAGPAAPNGQAWTPALYQQEIARLAA